MPEKLINARPWQRVIRSIWLNLWNRRPWCKRSPVCYQPAMRPQPCNCKYHLSSDRYIFLSYGIFWTEALHCNSPFSTQFFAFATSHAPSPFEPDRPQGCISPTVNALALQPQPCQASVEEGLRVRHSIGFMYFLSSTSRHRSQPSLLRKALFNLPTRSRLACIIVTVSASGWS